MMTSRESWIFIPESTRRKERSRGRGESAENLEPVGDGLPRQGKAPGRKRKVEGEPVDHEGEP
jgi:hypothetical protein